LFTGIGAAVAALVGPFGLTQLGSSVPVNLLITAVFVAFGLSLLGVFEITVPSSALTSLNKVSNRGGLLGTLVMGLVFALASFACTGPFIGALLAGSIQGDLSWPIFGMLMFSVGLALPFFFLALFPAYLSRMPKSGSWLARTKITVSFLIFAAALKYLSNVDQVYQWYILTRERYLAVWIVLLAMAGFYLLGMLRIGDEETGSVGAGRLGLGGVFLVLAVSLIPGMFGARLGELDAYVPSPEYSGLTSVGFGGAADSNKWIKDDYAQALELARETGKPVLISFTGYTCTNCHWMKANMFTRPPIAEALGGLVLLELYTDGADELSQAHQQMQLDGYGTVAIPYYAIIRTDESVIAEFPGRTRDTEEFLQFLTSGGTTQLTDAGGRVAAP
jgi:thiol:disulfide interchange protein DsbD